MPSSLSPCSYAFIVHVVVCLFCTPPSLPPVEDNDRFPATPKLPLAHSSDSVCGVDLADEAWECFDRVRVGRVDPLAQHLLQGLLATWGIHLGGPHYAQNQMAAKIKIIVDSTTVGPVAEHKPYKPPDGPFLPDSI